MYPNYPTYGTTNQMMPNQMQPGMNRYGYQQPYPQTYNSFPQAPNPVPTIIKGRIVTGVEEARAAQVDLDGTVSYFPSPAENKIYVKYVGMDGIAVFNVYNLEAGATPQQGASEHASLDALSKRVDAIENQLKGVIGNVQPATNDAVNEHGSAT